MTTHVDLAALTEGEDDGDGVHWTLGPPSELNVNLVRLDPGHRIEAHVGGVDVAVVVLRGDGRAVVDHTTHELGPHTLVHISKGAERQIEAGADGLWYLTVHRRREGPTISTSRPG
ncbi:MAG: hypothetical protein JJE52_01025 [Acidimicrobiia bacterium]|nr:hypothetical protein [Acidimicrobiia bacterium]